MSIRVKDNGQGIDDNFKDRTFEKFYQIDYHGKGNPAGSSVDTESGLTQGADPYIPKSFSIRDLMGKSKDWKPPYQKGILVVNN